MAENLYTRGRWIEGLGMALRACQLTPQAARAFFRYNLYLKFSHRFFSRNQARRQRRSGVQISEKDVPDGIEPDAIELDLGWHEEEDPFDLI